MSKSTCRMRHRMWLLLSLPLWLCRLATADWSPPIILWEDAPGMAAGPTRATVAVDAHERAHIAYEFTLPRHPDFPHFWMQGLAYVQYDDHGQQVVPPVFLNDSLDRSAANPRIHFFGEDSLWVAWFRAWTIRDTVTGRTTSPAHCALNYRGEILSLVCNWPELPWDYYSWMGLDFTPERHAVLVYSDLYDRIRCVVQRPDGSRILDHDVLWDGAPYGVLVRTAFVDATDSLQVAWWQSGPYSSRTVCAKRVALDRPFDSTRLADHGYLAPAEPGQIYSCSEFLPPRDDSLLAFILGEGLIGDDYLKVVRRADYAPVAQSIALGGMSHPAAFEADGTIGTWGFRPGAERVLRFCRFSYPALELVEDSAFADLEYYNGVDMLSYTVSPAGVRHLLYRWDEHEESQLIYRYWRADLAAEERQADVATTRRVTVSSNPFSTNLQLRLPEGGAGRAILYDLLGREVLSQAVEAGAQDMVIAAPELRALPSGIYFLRVIGRGPLAPIKLFYFR